MQHGDELDSAINHSADFEYDFFAFKVWHARVLAALEMRLGMPHPLGPHTRHWHAIGMKGCCTASFAPSRTVWQALIRCEFALSSHFAWQTLERSYLLRMEGKVAERPQHLLMRVALGIHGPDLEAALHSYRLMSEGWFTHASPTLFNAGTPHPQVCTEALPGAGQSFHINTAKGEAQWECQKDLLCSMHQLALIGLYLLARPQHASTRHPARDQQRIRRALPRDLWCLGDVRLCRCCSSKV